MIGMYTVAPLARLVFYIHLAKAPFGRESMTPSTLVGEIVVLLHEQLDTLERETFGGVTEAELCDYDDRLDLISKLYNELLKRRAAA